MRPNEVAAWFTGVQEYLRQLSDHADRQLAYQRVLFLAFSSELCQRVMGDDLEEFNGLCMKLVRRLRDDHPIIRKSPPPASGWPSSRPCGAMRTAATASRTEIANATSIMSPLRGRRSSSATPGTTTSEPGVSWSGACPNWYRRWTAGRSPCRRRPRSPALGPRCSGPSSPGRVMRRHGRPGRFAMRSGDCTTVEAGTPPWVGPGRSRPTAP